MAGTQIGPFMLPITAVLVAVTAVVSHIVQSMVPSPYMDEVFHIPQAQHYCDQNWTRWDPMITTLPGLYLASVSMIWPVSNVMGWSFPEMCSVQNLRGCNLLFTIGNFILLYLLSCKLNSNLQGKTTSLRNALNALVLAVFPVSYFISLLYYTDPGSTFYSLLMYLLCLHDRHFLAALSAAGAILFRQTNVVWLLFCVAQTSEDILMTSNKGLKKRLSELKDFEAFKMITKIIFSSFSSPFRFCKDIICGTFWYLCVGGTFALFVRVNRGIAVGDRTNHTAAHNFPQVFYFLMIVAAFSFVHMIKPRQIINFLYAVFGNPLKTVLFVAVACYLIKNYTYEHKYNLSDNRHYTFYVWQRIYQRHEQARYAMVAVYMYSLYQVYLWTIARGFLWRLSVSLCVCLMLIPHSLLEFRYFILPFYIIRLNMKLPSTVSLALELCIYVAVNAVTVHLFLNKPFYWPNEEQAQRFMW